MVREALTAAWLRSMLPDEAAAYFVVRGAEGLTAAEEDLFSDWLAENESHRTEFERAKHAWEAFAEAGDNEILGAMREHALGASPRTFAAWGRGVAVAAALLLVVLSTLLLTRGGEPVEQPSSGTGAIAELRYASIRGAKVQDIRLPDGSMVTLDADSEVRARLMPGERSLSVVRGRALFAVAPDRHRPFAVEADGWRSVAVGTRFAVDIASGYLEVSLLEGRLQVVREEGSARPLSLFAGQRLSVRGGRPVIEPIADRDAPASWRDGVLTFDDQRLDTAIAVVNRYSTLQLVIDEPSVGALRVSGRFRAGDPEGFARGVADLHHLRTRTEGGRIHLLSGR